MRGSGRECNTTRQLQRHLFVGSRLDARRAGVCVGTGQKGQQSRHVLESAAARGKGRAAASRVSERQHRRASSMLGHAAKKGCMVCVHAVPTCSCARAKPAARPWAAACRAYRRQAPACNGTEQENLRLAHSTCQTAAIVCSEAQKRATRRLWHLFWHSVAASSSPAHRCTIAHSHGGGTPARSFWVISCIISPSLKPAAHGKGETSRHMSAPGASHCAWVAGHTCMPLKGAPFHRGGGPCARSPTASHSEPGLQRPPLLTCSPAAIIACTQQEVGTAAGGGEGPRLQPTRAKTCHLSLVQHDSRCSGAAPLLACAAACQLRYSPDGSSRLKARVEPWRAALHGCKQGEGS